MFRNIIAPVQAWLLSQEHCTGCGLPLKEGKKETQGNVTNKVTCQCGRIFIYDKKTKRFHPALLTEIQK